MTPRKRITEDQRTEAQIQEANKREEDLKDQLKTLNKAMLNVVHLKERMAPRLVLDGPKATHNYVQDAFEVVMATAEDGMQRIIDSVKADLDTVHMTGDMAAQHRENERRKKLSQ